IGCRRGKKPPPDLLLSFLPSAAEPAGRFYRRGGVTLVQAVILHRGSASSETRGDRWKRIPAARRLHHGRFEIIFRKGIRFQILFLQTWRLKIELPCGNIVLRQKGLKDIKFQGGRTAFHGGGCPASIFGHGDRKGVVEGTERSGSVSLG